MFTSPVIFVRGILQDWCDLLSESEYAAYCDRCYRSVVCLTSVTLVHPTKAAGRNDMPFSRDSFVVPSNNVLDRGTGPPR